MCVVFRCECCLYFVFFFFSSRRRHTRFDCDWSSDVCSSDLLWEGEGEPVRALRAARRRYYGWGPESTRYLSSLLKDEGRLAALTGDREGAIRAYQHYLALSTDPEPSMKPEVDRVRLEPAMLVARR